MDPYEHEIGWKKNRVEAEYPEKVERASGWRPSVKRGTGGRAVKRFIWISRRPPPRNGPCVFRARDIFARFGSQFHIVPPGKEQNKTWDQLSQEAGWDRFIWISFPRLCCEQAASARSNILSLMDSPHYQPAHNHTPCQLLEKDEHWKISKKVKIISPIINSILISKDWEISLPLWPTSKPTQLVSNSRIFPQELQRNSFLLSRTSVCSVASPLLPKASAFPAPLPPSTSAPLTIQLLPGSHLWPTNRNPPISYA